MAPYDCAERRLAVVSPSTLEPAVRELGRQPFFSVYPLRLFNRQVGGHLVDPSRHPISQGPFDGEIGRMARLSRGEFGSLLFRPMLGGRELRLERFDMGFEGPDDVLGQRAFI
jgi:hypothetical protein